MVNQKKFVEIIEEWREYKKQYVKESTFSVYRLIIEKHIEPFFGDLYQINEEIIQVFVNQKLTNGLNEKTVKDILIVLKMIIKYGAKKLYIENYQYDIKFPINNQDSRMQVMSKSDQRYLINYVKNNFNFKNLGILICLFTGMRIGELCALQFKDIDIANSVIHVEKTLQRIYNSDSGTKIIIDYPKTRNSRREVPIASNLMNVLRPLIKITNKDCYVLTNELKPTEPRTYRNYYNKLLIKLEINKLKFHGLRHSFATRCVESKNDYKTISVILGHSNISTTLNLYVHPNNEQKKSCVEKMIKSFNIQD